MIVASLALREMVLFRAGSGATLRYEQFGDELSVFAGGVAVGGVAPPTLERVDIQRLLPRQDIGLPQAILPPS